jgi:hypothetical protein
VKPTSLPKLEYRLALSAIGHSSTIAKTPSVRHVFAATAFLLFISGITKAESGGWEYQPYRVRALIAIDCPGALNEQLQRELPTYLQSRSVAVLYPLWQIEFEAADGPERHNVLSSFANSSMFAAPPNKSSDKDDQQANRPDKLLLLTVIRTSTGFAVQSREYDTYVLRWSTPLRRECRQVSALGETLFGLVRQTLSPLARIEVDPQDPQHVTLLPRGSQLPTSPGTQPWAKAGDAFLPLVRRTTRAGALADKGLHPVPWTYLEAIDNGNKPLTFRVRSASRRPFAGRRQGRVEQLAIALRADPADTNLQLVSRKDDKKTLVGYEVLVQNERGEQPARINVSDTTGSVRIPAGASPVQMLLVKHGNQLLARLPVVTGAESSIRLPLPDDDARLAAEARLSALREELIDVVARRNILIARARQKIDKRDLAGAQTLVRTLADLPGKPQFDLTLSTSAQLLRSDDPIMQKRIDQLFQATQTLMTQYLDLKPINELNDELREAQEKASAKGG